MKHYNTIMIVLCLIAAIAGIAMQNFAAAVGWIVAMNAYIYYRNSK